MNVPRRSFRVSPWDHHVTRKPLSRREPSATNNKRRPNPPTVGSPIHTRVACVLIPRFGLMLYCREDPHLLLESLALAQDTSAAALIIEVNNKAAKSGVAVGMTAAQAEMLCNGLAIKLQRPQLELTTAQELGRQLQSVAPFVELVRPGLWQLAADGFDSLYGGESQLAEQIFQSLHAQGFPLQIGIADHVFAAQIAAELARSGAANIIPTGTMRGFLAPLKIKHLDLDAETYDQLLALGLRTIGQIAEFPANELATRFGAIGARIAHLARGNDPATFIPETPAEDTSARVIFDDPIFDCSPLIAQAEHLLTIVSEQLLARGEALLRISLQIKFADRTQQMIELALEHSPSSLRPFLRQLQERLGRAEFLSAVVELIATPVATTKTSAAQLDLTTRPAPTAAAAEQILKQSHYQWRHVCWRSSHWPERSFAFVNQPVLDTESDRVTLSELQPTSPPPVFFCGRSLIGLRLLPEPESIQVIREEQTLQALVIGSQRQAVVNCHGPWVISGGWWQTETLRRYYEIETAGGEVYLLFATDGDQWFRQGVFD